MFMDLVTAFIYLSGTDETKSIGSYGYHIELIMAIHIDFWKLVKVKRTNQIESIYVLSKQKKALAPCLHISHIFFYALLPFLLC